MDSHWEDSYLLDREGVILSVNNIRAATCDFQQCGILTSIDSDEPVQLSVKLRNSK